MFKKIYLCLFFIAFSSLSGFAQTKASSQLELINVTGQAVSTTGKPVSNAQVTITLNTGETRRTITNAFGYFHFNDIPSGQHFVVTKHKRYVFDSYIVMITAETPTITVVGARN